MPIYEYVCTDCKHEFEALQKLSEAVLKTCPACEKDSLKKKISAAGFRLSGSGWYETDFKSDRKKNIAQADSGEKGAASKSDDGKTGATGGDKADKAGKASGDGGKEAVA